MEHQKAKIYNPQHSLTALNKLTEETSPEIVEILQKSPVPKANGNGTFLLL